MLDQIIQDLTVKGWSFQQNFLLPHQLKGTEGLFKEDFRPAKVGQFQESQRVENIRGDWIKWIETSNPPTELELILSFLNELKTAVNEKCFLGIKDFECHLAKYPEGTFYRKHSDRFEKDSSRSLSFIFYLHQNWSREDGGELLLYNSQDEIVETILPLAGSFICFVSEDFPHEVKICHRERRSLTGWMHTKILT